MSEQPEMKADPLAQKLGQFTPDSSRLDRDALLVRLGQASARGGRLGRLGRLGWFWPLAAAMLAATQTVTLILLLTPNPEQPAGCTVLPVELPGSPTLWPAAEPSSAAPGLWSFRKVMQAGDLNDLPAEKAAEEMGGDDQVLTVLSARSALAPE